MLVRWTTRLRTRKNGSAESLIVAGTEVFAQPNWSQMRALRWCCANANSTVASPLAGVTYLGNGQNYFEGDMLELLIFDQDLTDNQRTTVNEYLRKKYNLWQQ